LLFTNKKNKIMTTDEFILGCNTKPFHFKDRVCADINIRGFAYNAVRIALQNQWQIIERNKYGFAIDDNLGDAIIREEDGTMYVNDGDEYIHNSACKYYMPIPELPINLKTITK
jgi:hypothetical protein